MATDPVTGAESYPTNDSLYQIPFKKLPFPFDNQTSVPEPGRTMYYPDDAPGVVANLAAHYENSSQAQSVHTDGKHALLVSDVNGSGGFPKAPYAHTEFNHWQSPDPFGPNVIVPDGAMTQAIYAVDVTLSIIPPPGPAGSLLVNIYVTTDFGDSFTGIKLATTIASTDGAQGQTSTKFLQFNPAIDLQALFGGVTCNVWYEMGSGVIGIKGACYMTIYGD